MGGKSTQDTTTSQTANSTTAPWEPTQGILKNILGSINGLNMSPNSAQTQGADQLVTNAQSMPNYGQQASSAVGSMFNLPQGMQSAYGDIQRQLSPIANQDNDPTKAPGMQALLDSIKNDVGNSINGMFAGAGRDMSGMNQQALARGLSQGMAAPLLNQYNQNVQNKTGAASTIYGAAGNNANTQSNLFNNAFGAVSQLPSIFNQGANNLLQAGNTMAGLPAQALALLEGLTLPIAGLGSQNTGQTTGQSNTTNQMSGAQQFGMITSGLRNWFGG